MHKTLKGKLMTWQIKSDIAYLILIIPDKINDI